ncbi:hypothetical protein ACTQ2N_08350 [Ruminococcus sp. LCP21S3_E8]|nr:hypothetical protein [Ruminococcus sp.]MCI5599646.1 hypothetical protein [Ruminococcus sp.]MCI6505761.1 hypothetical protein [Ruminococcus sp.]
MNKSENNSKNISQELENKAKNTDKYKFGILDSISTEDIEVMEKLLEEKYIEENNK